MAEVSGEPERIKIELQPWPDRFTVDMERDKYLERQRPAMLKQLRESNLFYDNVHPFEYNYAADFLNRLRFGMLQIQKRLGQNDDIPIGFEELNTQPDENGEYERIDITYNSGLDGVNISPSYLREVMRKKFQFGQVFTEGTNGGIMSQMTEEEHFELAGVEEAAHYYFVHIKTQMDKFSETQLTKKDIELDDQVIHYHTSDVEYRALFWKLAYLKEYFPESYADSLRENLRSVKKSRHGLQKKI